jgi:hypothetical protein
MAPQDPHVIPFVSNPYITTQRLYAGCCSTTSCLERLLLEYWIQGARRRRWDVVQDLGSASILVGCRLDSEVVCVNGDLLALRAVAGSSCSATPRLPTVACKAQVRRRMGLEVVRVYGDFLALTRSRPTHQPNPEPGALTPIYKPNI